MCARAERLAVRGAPIAARLAVMVVPMFSPNTKAAALGKLIKPEAAAAKVTAIMALEDWKIMVRIIPTPTIINRDPICSG